MSGYGTYYYSNGDRYEGNWKNDEKNGYGKYYWADCDKYISFWGKDNQNGSETFDCKDGFFENLYYIDDYKLSNSKNSEKTIFKKEGKSTYENYYESLCGSEYSSDNSYDLDNSSSYKSSSSDSYYDNTSYDNNSSNYSSNESTSSGISGEVHKDWGTGNIDRIGDNRLNIDAFGNLVSIGCNEVEYDWGYYGDVNRIKSIGGEKVEYDYVTGKIKSIGDKKVEYDYVTGEMKSIG